MCVKRSTFVEPYAAINDIVVIVPTSDSHGPREIVRATRETLQAEIARLAAVVGAIGHDVADFNPHVDAGCPYIELGPDAQLRWIVKERGQLVEQRTTRDPDELLYWCFEATTFALGTRWEASHRDETRDPRERLWAKQFEMLNRLNPEWAQRWRRELTARHPGDVGLMPN
jgi:hypothetical protein